MRTEWQGVRIERGVCVMEGSAVFLIFIGCLLFVAVLVVGQYYLEKKRTDAMERVASSLGFTFCKSVLSVPIEFGGFDLFTMGRSQGFTNLMKGDANGVTVAIFDFKYVTGSGKHTHTTRQTVIGFRSSRLLLPEFVLRPENFFDKVGSVFGLQDIDFPESPEFSRKYLLRCDDEARIRGLFSRSLMTHYAQHTGLSTEGAANAFIIYKPSFVLKPGQVNEFLKDGFTVFASLASQA